MGFFPPRGHDEDSWIFASFTFFTFSSVQELPTPTPATPWKIARYNPLYFSRTAL
jgi:hypothetical protein